MACATCGVLPDEEEDIFTYPCKTCKKMHCEAHIFYCEECDACVGGLCCAIACAVCEGDELYCAKCTTKCKECGKTCGTSCECGSAATCDGCCGGICAACDERMDRCWTCSSVLCTDCDVEERLQCHSCLKQLCPLCEKKCKMYLCEERMCPACAEYRLGWCFVHEPDSSSGESSS